MRPAERVLEVVRDYETKCTDLGNAERFVTQHGQDVRYCYLWGKWLVSSGPRWERDDEGKVHRLAKETVRSIYGEAAAAETDGRRKELARHATRSEAEARIRAMLELAKSEVPVSPDELDRDPWVLNCLNGTVDLVSGELMEHHREPLITKLAPVEYNPEAPAPTWDAFLKRVLPDKDVRTFVQRAVGYSLTGDTSERCMFINHGVGANGKSTFQEALSAGLGDYAMRAPTEMLMTKRPGGVPNDVARLKGARFVTASETEEGRRLAESLVKDLTGQDTITARFMRGEFFDFQPTHKLWVSTNHKPEIRGTDAAIWDRIRLVPWSVRIPPAEQDKRLLAKLRKELPGILAWAVRGCLEWRREGLAEPEEVRTATAAYRSEMDVLAAFIDERCVVADSVEAKATPLYNAYKEWAEASNEKAENQRSFGMRLTERGFVREKRGGTYRWLGIGLLSDDPGPDGPGAGPSSDNGPGKKTTPFAGKTRETETLVGLSGPKNHIDLRKANPRVAMSKKGPDGPDGPGLGAGDAKTPASRRLTDDEILRYRRLVREGMSPEFARAAVLGEEAAS